MKKILLINDDTVQLELYSLWLSEAGHKVSQFHNSEEALTFLYTAPVPDLIITDLYMPGIDGWRVCRLLRSPEYKNCNKVPILVISATFSGAEAEEITKELGANAFLSVPFKNGIFISTVEALLKGQGAVQKPKVLIVEDSAALLPLLTELFFRHNYSVLTAATGEDAVNCFEDDFPDVAVLDYYLPDMKGDLLLERFKKKNPKTVLIMMTTDPDKHLAVEWMKKGAWAYIRKPFELEYLMQLCSQALREKRLLHVEELLEERTHELWDSRRALKQSLNVKETLLKEIHHRVKNNLSIVASLLNLQASYISDRQAVKQFTEAKARIESMALVHEKIYQTEDLSALDLHAYIEDIVSQLIDTYSGPNVRILPTIKVPHIAISLDTAVPLGLILNELITNCLQHGSLNKEDCIISVSLQEEKTGYRLIVKDNGGGIPEELTPETTGSLGLTLVKLLAEQIGGEFSLYNSSGAVADIRFSVP